MPALAAQAYALLEAAALALLAIGGIGWAVTTRRDQARDRLPPDGT